MELQRLQIKDKDQVERVQRQTKPKSWANPILSKINVQKGKKNIIGFKY